MERKERSGKRNDNVASKGDGWGAERRKGGTFLLGWRGKCGPTASQLEIGKDIEPTKGKEKKIFNCHQGTEKRT